MAFYPLYFISIFVSPLPSSPPPPITPSVRESHLTPAQDLKTFFHDCYTYHFIYDTRTAPSYAGPQHVLEPCLVQGNPANNSVGRIYTLLHSKTFQTEHGVTMRGDQKLYLKHAFQRAIERDQYRLEDHSGNAAHVQNVFRKENWTKRTWLNAQLLLRFDNSFFNDVKNMQVS